MSVYYKFSPKWEYETVPRDGPLLSLGDLKKAIMFHRKRIGKNTNFDLRIRNAQTKKDYEDDNELIAKNTSFIIAKVPLTVRQRKRCWDERNETLGKVAVVDLTRLDGSEEDKIRATTTTTTTTTPPQSTRDDYDPSNRAYKKLKKERPPFSQDPESVVDKWPELIPEDPLLCNIYNDLFKVAVVDLTRLDGSEEDEIRATTTTTTTTTQSTRHDYDPSNRAYNEKVDKERPPFSQDPEPVVEMKPDAGRITVRTDRHRKTETQRVAGHVSSQAKTVRSSVAPDDDDDDDDDAAAAPSQEPVDPLRFTDPESASQHFPTDISGGGGGGGSPQQQPHAASTALPDDESTSDSHLQSDSETKLTTTDEETEVPPRPPAGTDETGYAERQRRYRRPPAQNAGRITVRTDRHRKTETQRVAGHVSFQAKTVRSSVAPDDDAAAPSQEPVDPLRSTDPESASQHFPTDISGGGGGSPQQQPHAASTALPDESTSDSHLQSDSETKLTIDEETEVPLRPPAKTEPLLPIPALVSSPERENASEAIPLAAERNNEIMIIRIHVSPENVDQFSAGMDVVTEADGVVVRLKIYGPATDINRSSSPRGTPTARSENFYVDMTSEGLKRTLGGHVAYSVTKYSLTREREDS